VVFIILNSVSRWVKAFAQRTPAVEFSTGD